jgi:hypothetical protein
MTTLETLRADARAHNERFEARAWLTVAQLAARWNVSKTTVRAIPRDVLPYKTFGRGEQLHRRRYHPDDVAAYEAAR